MLVERVEGFATPEQWQRAFEEINAFEEQLTEAGTIVVKFWLAISPDEQLRRFQDRQATSYKQYKLTPEDWRNRDRWDVLRGRRLRDDREDRHRVEPPGSSSRGTTRSGPG